MCLLLSSEALSRCSRWADRDNFISFVCEASILIVPVHFAELFGANVQGRFWSESEAKDACVIPANILVNPKYPSNVQKNKKLDELWHYCDLLQQTIKLIFHFTGNLSAEYSFNERKISRHHHQTFSSQSHYYQLKLAMV